MASEKLVINTDTGFPFIIVALNGIVKLSCSYQIPGERSRKLAFLNYIIVFNQKLLLF